MNLAGLFQYGSKNTENRVTSGGKGSVSGHAASGNSSQTVRGLAQGQSIHGEVIGKNGNEVQIRVDKDVVITAKLDRDIPVSVGQSMTFEVKNRNCDGVHLSFSGTDADGVSHDAAGDVH